jgi:DNA mismatch repair protein MutS
MDFLDNIINLIDSAIDEDAQNNISQWNIIARGFNKSIDEDRSTVEESHKWIIEYKRELIELSGISSLKIKFTHNTGYFIEIPLSQLSHIPESFVWKQTLTQANRYSTIKLQDFEQNLNRINTTLFQKEYECFLDIRSSVLQHFNDLYYISRQVSKLDFYMNGAYLVSQKQYIIPEISSNYSLNIQGWKHPVISEESNDFISNDLSLEKKDFIHVITGPNMGWKSTYLRQNALIIILAHMGYPVPASRAVIPITDKVFSRVWGGDNLFLWQSTFMVEMQEIAYILHNSTKKSFVIIDEIWRGTSTYDGMSLAWAILQHNHNAIQAKTLFATHYHEIIDHAAVLKWSSNYSVAVGENEDNIVFLRKIIPWGIKKSYWIEVAKLAGIPPEVLLQARKAMIDLNNNSKFEQLSFVQEHEENSQPKKTKQYSEVIDMILEININTLSPLDALIQLEKLQKQVKK